MFVSMANRHPDGDDAGYLEWHTLDHRPEQHRLSSLCASLRVVSTPACRAARAASQGRFDTVDHVMAYFWTDVAGLDVFDELSSALGKAGRKPFILPPVDRGVYSVDHRAAATRIKAGSDVLPWRPARGVFLLVEEGDAPAPDVTGADGVAGVWSGTAKATPYSSVQPGQRLTYCFLDGDPIQTAGRLEPLLEQRWRNRDCTPLLAAPFHVVIPFEWDRYVP
jgi:hypothetical protein